MTLSQWLTKYRSRRAVSIKVGEPVKIVTDHWTKGHALLWHLADYMVSSCSKTEAILLPKA